MLAVAAPAARAAAASEASEAGVDAAGGMLASAGTETKPPTQEAYRIPPRADTPHVARPYRGPKPKQEGLQLQANPRVFPIRLARFLGWALVP